jgi:hypothetical protein
MGLVAESSKNISIVGVTTFEHNSLEVLLDQASEHDALAVVMLTSDAAPPSWVVSVQSKKRTMAIAKTLYWFQSSSAAGEKLNVAFAQATRESPPPLSSSSPLSSPSLLPCSSPLPGSCGDGGSGGGGQNMPNPHVPVVDEQHIPSVHVIPVAGPHSRLVIG